MNRAAADNQSAQAEEEGLEPTKERVKDLVDEVLAEELASPDLKLTWLSPPARLSFRGTARRVACPLP
jgi:hypothetical protein